jgi:hypothetical protein
MENEIKLSEDELKSIIDLRDQIRENVEIIGKLNIQKYFLENELQVLRDNISEGLKKSLELGELERSLTEDIVGRYGEGQLDFATGVYTKNS